MKRRPARRVAWIALVVAGSGAGIGAGCTGSLFQSKAVVPAVYLLTVGPAAVRTADAPPAIAADLAVQRPRVRAGLDTDRIAVLYPDRRLDYFAGANWSGPLDQVVQDLAVAALRAGARFRNVSADASAFASTYWLEIEVVDFQAEYAAAGTAPTVHVRLLARVGSAGDRRILATADAGASATATDNRLTAIVAAYQRAADAALADLAAQTSASLAAARP